MKRLIYILFISFLLFSIRVKSQVFPVQTSVQLIPPYSLNLQDYTSEAFNRIQASIYMSDLSQVNYQARLRLVIKGANGILLQTRDDMFQPPLIIQGGETILLNGLDLAELFNPEQMNFAGITKTQYYAEGGLPEGYYEFNIEVLDYAVRKSVSNVNSGFASAWLIRNDPPIINAPANNITISPLEPQNIFFQWTPRHTGSPNSAFTTVYDISLVEVYPASRNPNDAINTSMPLFEFTTYVTSFNYGIAEPYLIPGRKYAFRVRARDELNRDLFKNQGYSEVFTFNYFKPCINNSELEFEESDNGVKVYWESSFDQSNYDLKYRLKEGGSAWQIIKTTNNKVLLEGLEKGKEYEFKLRPYCDFLAGNYGTSFPFKSKYSSNQNEACTSPQPYEVVKKNDYLYQVTFDPIDKAMGYKVQVLRGNGWDTITKKSTSPTFLIKSRKSSITSFRIATVCQEGVSWGKWQKLRKGMVGGSCPVLSPDHLEFTEVGDLFRVQWESSLFHKSYVFKYKLEHSQQWIEVPTMEPHTYLPTGIADGFYNVQVVYVCNEGNALGRVQLIEIDRDVTIDEGTGSCFPPVQLVHQMNDDLSVDIEWERLSGIDTFKLEIKQNHLDVWTSILTEGHKYTLEGLLPNTSYEYRVSARCKDDKWSLPSNKWTFQTYIPYNGDGTCDEVEVLESEVENVHVNLEWTGVLNHTSFIVFYRKKGENEWFEKQVIPPLSSLDDLQESTTYEWRILPSCGTKDAKTSDIFEFETGIKADDFECGGLPEPMQPENGVSKEIRIGDDLMAADFDFKVLRVSGSGTYNGEGEMRIPYLKNSRVNVKLVDVEVNEQGQMFGGKIVVIGAQFQALSPELVEQINGVIATIDDLKKRADLNYAMLSTALKQLEDAINENADLIDQFGEEVSNLKIKIEGIDRDSTGSVKNDSTERKGLGSFSFKDALDELSELAEAVGAAVVDAAEGIAQFAASIKRYIVEALEAIKVDLNLQIAAITLDINLQLDSINLSLSSLLGDRSSRFIGVSEDYDEIRKMTPATQRILTTQDLEALRKDPRLGKVVLAIELYIKLQANLGNIKRALEWVENGLNPDGLEALTEDLEEELKDLALKLVQGALDGDTEDEMKERIKKYLDTKVEEIKTLTKTE